MTTEQLATYLEHCANLADTPNDGIAWVRVDRLREAIELLKRLPSQATGVQNG